VAAPTRLCPAVWVANPTDPQLCAPVCPRGLSQNTGAQDFWDKNMNPNTSTGIISEQNSWERLREIAIRKGGPLHPAYRYPDWAAFCRAKKPWHNHGDPEFRDLKHGDRWREEEAFLETWRRKPSLQQKMAEARAMFGIPDRRTAPPPQEESPPELIPAAARWQMLAESQGGYGATGITPSSPDKQIRDHLDGIARNGFKPPPGLSLA